MVKKFSGNNNLFTTWSDVFRRKSFSVFLENERDELKRKGVRKGEGGIVDDEAC